MKQIKAATQKGNTVESLKKKMESKAMRVQYSASTDRQTDIQTDTQLTGAEDTFLWLWKDMNSE